MAAIYAWCFWSWRFRIPFAKVMLKTVTSITRRYPALIATAVVALIVQFAFTTWWMVTVIGIIRMGNDKKVSSGVSYALYVYAVINV